MPAACQGPGFRTPADALRVPCSSPRAQILSGLFPCATSCPVEPVCYLLVREELLFPSRADVLNPSLWLIFTTLAQDGLGFIFFLPQPLLSVLGL